MTDIRIFDKPALSTEEHITVLKKRGLVIGDEKEATHYLEHVGYYHLSAYMKPFQIADDPKHTFAKDIRFSDIVNAYDFDRKIRLLTLDALEKIETSLKSSMCNILSLNEGPSWYSKQNAYKASHSLKTILPSILESINFGLPSEEIKNQSIEHYYNNYDYPFYPPAWMVFEGLSFGNLSMIFMHLNKEYSNKISEAYGLPREILISWFRSLTYTRNLCAHHARLWNRGYTISPATYEKRLGDELQNNNTFYGQAVIIKVLLSKITPNGNWHTRLIELIKEYGQIDTSKMGFPNKWNEREFWKSN